MGKIKPSPPLMEAIKPTARFDHRGRIQFLHACEKISWGKKSKPLYALASDVWPHFSNLWHFADSYSLHYRLERYPSFFKSLSEATEDDGKVVAEDLRKWADVYGFQDAWILDAAVCTLENLVPKSQIHMFIGEEATWYQRVLDEKSVSWHFPFRVPDFEFGFDPWYGKDWNEYHASCSRQFQARLQWYKEFVLNQRRKMGAALPKHAEWTAMVFQGLTYGQVSRKSGKSRQAVQKAITSFAQRIGLSLPPRVTTKKA